jgi:integrase/recombinase XerD
MYRANRALHSFQVGNPAILRAAPTLGKRKAFRRHTYSILFALLACMGLRVSKAIHLSFQDITADGLVIRC